MSESANNMIPAEIRAQFPQDEQGRVLFFTTPPVNTTHIVEGRSTAEKGGQLSHSLKYLAKKADHERELVRKHSLDIDAENQNASDSHKRVKPNSFSCDGEERDADGRIRANPKRAQEIAAEQAQRIEILKTRALATLVQQMNQGNDEFYKIQYGDKAEEFRKNDALKQQELLKEGQQRNGQTTGGSPDVIGEFKRSPWNGLYKDDYDARY